MEGDAVTAAKEFFTTEDTEDTEDNRNRTSGDNSDTNLLGVERHS
jgi:hypothetical protein